MNKKNNIIIQKRDGSFVPFDPNKIINAINKAFIEVDGQLYEDDTARDIAKDIESDLIDLLDSDGKASIEYIQDLVEDYLMQSDRRDVARAYIRYRYKREVARNGGDEFIKAFSAKINGKDIENQNANVDEMSFGGRIGAGSDLQMKKYALDYCVSDMARRNHENNEIYIHDLSAYAVGMHNCLTIPFDDLLAKGFNTRQTDVRPAGSVNTAFQLVAVIFQLQSLQQFGGVSAGHLDWTMVPYVRKSFTKHYRTGLKYFEDFNPDGNSKNEFFNLRMSIEYPGWDDYSALPLDLYERWPDSKGQSQKAYDYAIEQTKKEVHQAVEGMYHNLK